MYLIFDTETTGLPANYNAPVTDTDNWPRMVQLAWECHDQTGRLLYNKSFIIRPEGYVIPQAAEQVHGISTEKALAEGMDLETVLRDFDSDLRQVSVIVGHNISFDLKIAGAEYVRKGIATVLHELHPLCTKETSTDFCALPGGKGNKFKWPTLSELHNKLFNVSFEEAHNATADVAATSRCFFELIRREIITARHLKIEPSLVKDFLSANPDVIRPFPVVGKSNAIRSAENEPEEVQRTTP